MIICEPIVNSTFIDKAAPFNFGGDPLVEVSSEDVRALISISDDVVATLASETLVKAELVWEISSVVNGPFIEMGVVDESRPFVNGHGSRIFPEESGATWIDNGLGVEWNGSNLPTTWSIYEGGPVLRTDVTDIVTAWIARGINLNAVLAVRSRVNTSSGIHLRKGDVAQYIAPFIWIETLASPTLYTGIDVRKPSQISVGSASVLRHIPRASSNVVTLSITQPMILGSPTHRYSTEQPVLGIEGDINVSVVLSTSLSHVYDLGKVEWVDDVPQIRIDTRPLLNKVHYRLLFTADDGTTWVDNSSWVVTGA